MRCWTYSLVKERKRSCDSVSGLVLYDVNANHDTTKFIKADGLSGQVSHIVNISTQITLRSAIQWFICVKGEYPS